MKTSKLIYIALAVCVAFPFVDTPIALLMGIVLVQLVENPFPETSKKLTKILLQASVVGLGFGMNAVQALQVGKENIVFTVISICSTLIVGLFLGKILKIDKNTSYLISSGTAICGGSAIAAISSVIKSNQKQISTALGCIFILNSLALFLFPWIGHQLHMSQHQFGVWAALAIHDTSSVVGAASHYGNEALQTATTIKLERALWIIPLSIFSVFFFGTETKKISIPYFILFFVLAMLVNTFVPDVQSISGYIVLVSKIGLKLSLFLIGSSLSRSLITSVGIKPFFQGVLLWMFISVLSLVAIMLALV